jgi:membrane associated rhomboid family serine protease
MLLRIMGKLPVGTKDEAREGIALLAGVVVLMWIIEVINTIDSNRLDQDGILSRNVSHLWGIFTAPFLHVSFAHLIGNTVPFVFMGVIIALRGALRLITISVIIIILGGILTWLIGPSNTSTVGASGLIFGYATYLFARGFFDKNVVEVLVGLVVGVIWGGTLLSALHPQHGISWQGHISGAIAGVVAAWFMARHDGAFEPDSAPATT